MTDSQARERERVSAERLRDEKKRMFCLSCGCCSVTVDGKLDAIVWCPRHATTHGTTTAKP